MPIIKPDQLSRLVGNLWQPKAPAIEQLRTRYPLVNSPLSSLATSLPEQENRVAPAPPAKNLLSPPTTVANAILSTPLTKTISTTIEAKTPHAVSESSKELISDWTELTNTIKFCENCKLCYGRKQVVIERGNRNAAWMFIGEGPGEQEDLQGLPFVGSSGQLLDKMIRAMGLEPASEVYISNVVKCRPPNNRNPEGDELAACNAYLQSQIKLVKPQIIITLGRYAAQTLLKSELAIGKLRGVVHDYQGIPAITTYHPAYLLRTPNAKKEAWADLQLALQTFNSSIKHNS